MLFLNLLKPIEHTNSHDNNILHTIKVDLSFSFLFGLVYLFNGMSPPYGLFTVEIWFISKYFIGNLLLFRMVHCVFILLLWLFCSHPFFGWNAFLISGIKPFVCTLVRKYAEGKGRVADSVCKSTTRDGSLLLPLLSSRQDREQTSLLWICLDLQTSGLWISTSKNWIPFFYFSTVTERRLFAIKALALKYVIWTLWFNLGKLNSLLVSWHGRKQMRLLWLGLDLQTSELSISTSKSWIRFFFFFTSQLLQRMAACYEGSGSKVNALDIIIQLRKVEILFLLHGRVERTCLM